MVESLPNRLGISSFVRWPCFACLLLVAIFSLSNQAVLAGQNSAESATTTQNTDPKDAETQKFEAELRQFELRQNIVASFVYAFQISSPEQRTDLWQQLEQDKAEAVELRRQQEADALDVQPQPPGGYDAETLRYKVAVEKLDLPADVVDDLVEMFQANDAPFRETLWERVKESPLNQE
jgi:hypothetical protein